MSTFMTESYDAPMTDAGDNDVSMYPTLATADSWLSVEGSMGDDGFPSNSATVDYAQAGVEVEMGDDVEIIEYEMADEGGDYGGQEGLQDIEVYDISEFSSSLPVERHPHAYGGVETEFTSVPSFEGPLPQSHTTPVVTSDAVVAFKVDEATSTHTTSHSTPRSDAAGTHHDAAHTGIAAVPDTEEPVLETNQADGGGVASALATTPFQTQPPVDEAAGLEDSSHERTGLEPSGEPLIPDKPGVADQGEYADLERTNPSASDPHEISEGVYIDPPPPVLLSLPPFAEFIECSLFNLPTSSLSQSPSSSVKSGDTLHLMLHDRPILYYEPLSAVFTALRQEPCIQRMPGFSEAELVLDAYELQLSISEDNVYTHEVTLHELNVIHDGSDLSGPLRLRLKVHIPRFVARYTTLRDQIARLNLTGDGDGTHTDDILGDRQYEPGLTVDYDARHEPEGEDTHTEGGVTQEMQKNAEPQSGQGGHEADDLHSADADAVQEQVEATAATEDGEHGAVDSDVAAEDDGVATQTEAKFQVLVDEPTEEPETEFEESVDADEVHQPVVEEGGDYVDHAEFQDDENEYGEDLPEDFGGNAEEDADYQVTATPISFEQDQVEQRYEEVPAGAGGEEERHESTGLHVNGDTDTLGHSNSIEGGLSGGHSFNSEVREQDNIQNADDQCAFHQENVVITVDDDGIGLNDNWDDAEDKVVAKEDRPEALSRKSSTTTLASRSSKRGYEEVDLDDFDDEDFNTAPSSPDTKRLRVQ